MYAMYEHADAFNGDIDVWDVSSATDTSSMFYEANAFNADIGARDVSYVTDTVMKFYYAYDFNADTGGGRVVRYGHSHKVLLHLRL